MSYASLYEQTHSRQCCNLLIVWLWTQPVIVLPSVARACDDQSTVHLDWQLGGYSSARVRNVWGINRVLLRISIWFSCQFAGFHVANRSFDKAIAKIKRCSFLDSYERSCSLQRVYLAKIFAFHAILVIFLEKCLQHWWYRHSMTAEYPR